MDEARFDAWFECIGGCGIRHELTEIIYRCEKCGELLEVRHDMGALEKERTGDEWKALFDGRVRSNEWPYGSGVWGKKEIICPAVSNENIVSMYEGNTNLFWARRLGERIGLQDLWVKLCGNTHSGSFKDLGMTVLISMVKEMMSRGTEILAVACASTGDTSAALACYSAAAGIPAVVFLPKGKVSSAQLIQPIANGAITLAIDTDFDGCMKIVQEITRKNEIYLANSMNSLRVEGQKSISVEIVQQLGWEVPDWIIIPGGNLGNVSALGKGFVMMRELGMIDRYPRIVCAQASRANPLYLSYLKGFEGFKPVTAGRTSASAIRIGNPVSVNKAIRILKEFNGIVEQATEDELAEAAALGDLTGLYNCPHTGVALAVLFKLIERGTIGGDERVVVISTAHGLKFTDFKIKYHESRLEDVESRHSNLPIEIEADADAVEAAIMREIEKRG